METKVWAEMDDFITGHMVKQDAELRRALRNSAAASLPPIQVGAAQGKLLWLLGRAINARRILEIGTLGGYSTIWLAKALPASGRLISMELDGRHAAVARENVAQAGLADRVQILQGQALELLPLVAGQHPEGFDFVFIDADKPNSPQYYEWAVKLVRPGGVIVVDNVVREGAVIRGARDASAAGVRRMLETMGADERVSATVIQTVCGKGYDGFAIALRTGEA